VLPGREPLGSDGICSESGSTWKYYSPGTMEVAHKEISGRSIHPYAPIVGMATKASLFNFEQLSHSRTTERGRPTVLSRLVARPAESTTGISEKS